MPEHLAYSWWYWQLDRGLDDMVFDFTVHNDPGDFSDRYGLYLMVCAGTIAGNTFYFGCKPTYMIRRWAGIGARA